MNIPTIQSHPYAIVRSLQLEHGQQLIKNIDLASSREQASDLARLDRQRLRADDALVPDRHSHLIVARATNKVVEVQSARHY